MTSHRHGVITLSETKQHMNTHETPHSTKLK